MLGSCVDPGIYAPEDGRDGVGVRGWTVAKGWRKDEAKEANRMGHGESLGWRLCSSRLHLTLYEPMKWLNHFTPDVYNTIDPYLFIRLALSQPLRWPRRKTIHRHLGTVENELNT